MSSTIQSTPGRRLRPVMALHGRTVQWCVLMQSRSSALIDKINLFFFSKKILKMILICELTWLIVSRLTAPWTSCLFANTSSDAPASLCKQGIWGKYFLRLLKRTSSIKSECSSCLQSLRRDVSVESTTHTSPSVCSK